MRFERNTTMYNTAAINSPVLSIYTVSYGVAHRHSLLYSARTESMAICDYTTTRPIRLIVIYVIDNKPIRAGNGFHIHQTARNRFIFVFSPFVKSLYTSSIIFPFNHPANYT